MSVTDSNAIQYKDGEPSTDLLVRHIRVNVFPEQQSLDVGLEHSQAASVTEELLSVCEPRRSEMSLIAPFQVLQCATIRTAAN